MLSMRDLVGYRKQCAALFDRVGIVLTPQEREHIEIADFGLGNFPETVDGDQRGTFTLMK